MRFHPTEVLFSATSRCNLNCPHCVIERSGRMLSARSAAKFLRECKGIGIKRVGFTGGEPFLNSNFLCALTREAVKNDMLFDRIMTNGVWHRDEEELKAGLGKLFRAGYDGDICVSIDAFHRQGLKKLASFIKIALSIWKRFDIISLACTFGAQDGATLGKLKKLSRLLDSRLTGLNSGRPCIKGAAAFIRIFRIQLAPIGKAAGLRHAWDGEWFREDHCKGPGNVLFVMPDGSVKPCCGYANAAARLTVGNIRCDSARDILRNASSNRFVRAVFTSGLSRIRKALESEGVPFPGKTTSHCYFCHYIINEIPEKILNRCLN